MFCSKCGNQCPENFIVCPKCGTKLSTNASTGNKKLLRNLGIVSIILGPIIGFLVAVATDPNASTIPDEAVLYWTVIALIGIIVGSVLISSSKK
ncbi:MAG: zinc-ribbon domain-containing protein [Oscillospiraceae bacterium]|nr:zinc-ribbon domain-containing protein [Oscillospiraceae bacterium]